MTIETVLNDSVSELLEAGFVHGEREADIILSDILEKDTAWLLANYDKELETAVVETMEQRVANRLKGEPLAYIIGHQQFLGWNFTSDKRALIPRPETEQLTELLVREIQKNKLQNGHFLEIGTGAGVIAIALKKYFPASDVTATDISHEALELAEENAKKLNVEIEFMESDLFSAVPPKKYDLVVANLPYVPSPKLSFVSDQILDWEPMVAIEAGEDGLQYITPFLQELGKYLAEDGIAAIEMWHDHGEAVKELVEKHLPDYEAEVVKDLAGFDRFALIISS